MTIMKVSKAAEVAGGRYEGARYTHVNARTYVYIYDTRYKVWMQTVIPCDINLYDYMILHVDYIYTYILRIHNIERERETDRKILSWDHGAAWSMIPSWQHVWTKISGEIWQSVPVQMRQRSQAHGGMELQSPAGIPVLQGRIETPVWTWCHLHVCTPMCIYII